MDATSTSHAEGGPPAATGGVRRLRLAPARALLALAAALLILPAAAEVAFPQAAWVLGACACGLVILAGTDARLGVGSAGGVTVALPRVSRLTLNRPGVVEVTVGAARARSVRIGLDAARALGLDTMEPVLALEGAASLARVSWRAMPERRGSFRVDAAHLEATSPLGLWTVRWAEPVDGEVRVYPDLRAEGRQIAALFLRRSSVGAHRQRMIGRGRDFEKLREYLPGDGYDEIHWKATAKRGHPVTKVFQVERTQEVYAVVDGSRLSGRGAGAGTSLLERQINATLALAMAAERQGDLFGLVTYADQPRAFLRARGGAAHFQACREAMLSLQGEPVSPDMRDVCTFLRSRLRKRALLVFLTSLDDPALAEAFVDAVHVIARRHIVVVATPRPPDARPLFEGEAPGTLDEAYARLGGHVRWQGLQDLGLRLRRAGVQLVLLERDQLAAGVLSHYLELKQRQVI